MIRFKKQYTVLFLLFVSLTAQAQVDTLKNYSKSDSTTWLLPAAYTENGVIDFTSFPNEAYTFNVGYGSLFKVNQPGTLDSFRFYLEGIQAEVSDSSFTYADSKDSLSWKFSQRRDEETFEKYAQLIQAPYVGNLESITFPAQKVLSGDNFNDSLIIRFHPPLLSVTSSQSYYNNGIVWFFGLPRSTNNVTQYGVKFTAPETEVSSKLQGVDLYIFSINDTRFYSGYDTPANDTLIVRVYDLDENGLPQNALAEKRSVFSELSSGFDNRFDFSSFNLQFAAGTSYVVSAEVKRVGNQDFIGLVSGTSFATPIDRTVMFENDGWIYLSQSASWGGGGAKGAEIRATAIYEDPNNKTPNSEVEISPYVAVSFSALKDTELNTVSLKSPLALYEGEEVWVSFEQRIRGFRDSLSVFSDTLSLHPETTRSAFYGKNGTTKFWYFTQNSPFINKNINFKVQANFSHIQNDRLTFDLYRVENSERLFERGLSIPLNQLNAMAWNSIDLSEWNYSVDTDMELFGSIGIYTIQDSDGIQLRSDLGNAERNSASSFIQLSKEENGSVWKELVDTNYPSLWTEMHIKSNPIAIDEFEDFNQKPLQTELIGAFPNPFNPTTSIRFSLAQQLNVQLSVYDIVGRLVSSQQLGRLSSGIHSVPFNANGLSSGVYLYQLRTESKILTGKMTLMK